MLLLAVGATLLAGTAGLLILYPWLIKDFKYLYTVMKHIKKYSNKHKLYIDYFEDNVKADPNKIALIYKDKSFTYQELNENAIRVARAAQSLGLQCGDTIAVLMHNSPEFVWINIGKMIVIAPEGKIRVSDREGLMKIGVKPALINTSLKGKQLLHCINASDPKIILVGEDEDLGEAIHGILPDLHVEVFVYCSGRSMVSSTFKNFHDITEKMSDEEIDSSVRQPVNYNNCNCYIFTSGTTGLPKPAIVSDRRVQAGVVVALSSGATKDDIFYNSLPLFHSNGLILCLYAGLGIGATVVTAKKFSRTHYFEDCRKYNITVINYIGELFRFLLANDKSDLDGQHKIRIAIGNGLRQDIYQETVDRFKIPNICELYAATEAPIGFLNLFNKVGSCGRASPFLGSVFKCGFYKFDAEKECLARDSLGHCIPVKQGEPGLLLSAVSEFQKFDGYKGKKEITEAKLVRNVVKDGDVFFNSGDLFTRDKEYFLYFNDRIGDTYRWKGENVSTTEVSNILTDLDFVTDACVYGVTIPGQDGKAGMATLLIDSEDSKCDDEMLDKISEFCTKTFPIYSRPVFIRLQWGSLSLTATIKQNKVSLKQEAFDVIKVSDPLFYFDKTSSKYKKVDATVHSQIVNKTIQF